MSMGALCSVLLLTGLVAVSTPREAQAQGWSAGLSAGSTAYELGSADVSTDNVMGHLRYDARRGAWVYGTVGAPLGDEDTTWGALGAGGRLAQSRSGPRHGTAGLEFGTHGFVFRDAVSGEIGRGGILEAMPFASVSAGAARVELRGGWRGQMLSFAGDTQNRGVFEAGARVGYEAGLRVQADVRWVRAREGTYPFVGGMLLYGGSRVHLWGQVGKWLSHDLDDLSCAIGAGIALGAHTSVSVSARWEARDPLFWNPPRRLWTIGVTRRLGWGSTARAPVSHSLASGVTIRVPLSQCPAGDVSIAGDFNNWRALSMQREGDEWVVRLSLAPGVYYYAFRSADNEWFVPASTAGRRSDGMNGHIAVLVVD